MRTHCLWIRVPKQGLYSEFRKTKKVGAVLMLIWLNCWANFTCVGVGITMIAVTTVKGKESRILEIGADIPEDKSLKYFMWKWLKWSMCYWYRRCYRTIQGPSVNFPVDILLNFILLIHSSSPAFLPLDISLFSSTFLPSCIAKSHSFANTHHPLCQVLLSQSESSLVPRSQRKISGLSISLSVLGNFQSLGS